jgi:hypothetical protein
MSRLVNHGLEQMIKDGVTEVVAEIVNVEVVEVEVVAERIRRHVPKTIWIKSWMIL